MRKAYSYIRFSSKKQAAGDSLSRQKDLAKAYALANDLDLDTSLNFADLGVSGYTGEHVATGALGLFIKAVESGLVPKGSVLLIENMDRLSRQLVSDALPVFMGLLKSGVDIVTLTDGKRFTESSLDNPYEFMGSVFPMFRANEESKLKSDRVKLALKRKRSANLPVVFGNGPIWLTPKADKSGWDVVEPLAETVRWVFATYLAGTGVKTLAKLGNESGRPFGKKNRFLHTQVWRMLRNPAVIGTWELGERRNGKMAKTGELRENYYPAIISEEVYYKAQAKLDSSSFSVGRKDATYRNLLQGIIRCGHCGAVMTRKRGSVAGKPEIATYTCGSRSAGTHKCPTIAAHRLEPVVIPALYSLAPAELQSSELVATLHGTIAVKKAELTSVNLKLNKVSDSYLLLLDTDEDMPATMVAVMRKLESQQAVLTAELTELNAKQAALSIGFTNNNFNSDDILSLIISDKPEDVVLRFDEHIKLKSNFSQVFVWAEDVAAVSLPNDGGTVWFPLSKRHITESFSLSSGLDPELASLEELRANALRNADKIYNNDDLLPAWFLNRPSFPDGFKAAGLEMPVVSDGSVRYPEPKVVRNAALVRPVTPVRVRPAKVKALV